MLSHELAVHGDVVSCSHDFLSGDDSDFGMRSPQSLVWLHLAQSVLLYEYRGFSDGTGRMHLQFDFWIFCNLALKIGHRI